MASHFSVTEASQSGKSFGVRLRELDDSRRGARFSNRKEDVLLQRKLSYLNNQRKRTQISINREKEFIKSRNPKDKDMNHLDRRYREAMGFILDYKAGQGFEQPLHHITTISTVKTEATKWKRGKVQSGESQYSDKKCVFDNKKWAFDNKSALARTKSAPAERSFSKTLSSGSDVSNISNKTLSRGISKLSVETPTESSSDNESEVCDLLIKAPLRPSTSHAPEGCNMDTLSATNDATARQQRVRSLHRMNTSNKTDFWTVLRQTRYSGSGIQVGNDSEGNEFNNQRTKSGAKINLNERFKAKTKEIIDKERVIQLFLKVDRMKDCSLPTLPDSDF